MTTEEKAKAYAENQLPVVDWGFDYEDIKRGFLAGADFALSSQWTRVEDGLPEDGEYVLISTERGIEASVWNEHHQCWDDAEGDDYMYSKDYVKAWLRIPALPDGKEGEA